MFGGNDRGRLLLTRLREESHSSASKLRRRGWSVCRAPLLSLEALPAFDLAEKLGEKPALLITSKSALRMLARTHDAWRERRQHFATSGKPSSLPLFLPLYAVGAESAALAKRMGFASVRAARGTLESLIKEVRRQHPKSEPLLHLSGKHRRGNLVESLQKMGYSACRCVLYEAVSVQKLPPSASNLLNPSMHSSFPSPLYASLFYSPRTADIFANLYAQTFGKTSMTCVRLRFFCLSPSIGVRLQKFFPAAQVHSAAIPSETCLFDTLEQEAS